MPSRERTLKSTGAMRRAMRPQWLVRPPTMHPGEVEQEFGPARVEVQLDHHIRAALDGHGLWMRRLDLQRLGPGRWLQELHRAPSFTGPRRPAHPRRPVVEHQAKGEYDDDG